jgi:hypothetical protein
MKLKPIISISRAIGCLEDLSSALTSNCEDIDIKELNVAISMGIRALRKVTIEDICDLSDK